MHRNNRDCERSNAFGQSLIELCCTYGVHILNGRLYDDIVGNFTCLTHNGASVVDYHIALSELFQFVILTLFLKMSQITYPCALS